VPEDWQELWRHKADSLIRDKAPVTPEELYGRAAIYAEFGKVICISCGVLVGAGGGPEALLKSFYGDDEKMSCCGSATCCTNGGPKARSISAPTTEKTSISLTSVAG
jgi:hypothetical protein